MARKTLLTESEIRRFLKLASMPVVGDTRIEEIADVQQEQEEESLEEGGGEGEYNENTVEENQEEDEEEGY